MVHVVNPVNLSAFIFLLVNFSFSLVLVAAFLCMASMNCAICKFVVDQMFYVQTSGFKHFYQAELHLYEVQFKRWIFCLARVEACKILSSHFL